MRRHPTFIVQTLAFIFVLSFVNSSAQAKFFDPERAKQKKTTSQKLKPQEVDLGLKEALKVSTQLAVGKASKLNGFYKNPLIFIPFPPQAREMKKALESLGMRPQIERLTRTLNRAAEVATKKAGPIFLNAIKGLTIQDGYRILTGPNNAATQYLQRKTSRQLQRAFQPEVRKALNQVEVTRYWKPLVTRYNQIPFVNQVNPNLDAYVTDRAVSGLFKLMAQEEARIRKNPAARVNTVLQRVFGS